MDVMAGWGGLTRPEPPPTRSPDSVRKRVARLMSHVVIMSRRSTWSTWSAICSESPGLLY